MIHLLLPHNIRLKQLRITLLNKVLLIHIPQMHLRFILQYDSKQLLQQDNQFYKLQRILQLKRLHTKYTICFNRYYSSGNILHSNALPNYTTSRNFSRPPLQTLTTNPLSYNLTGTNPGSTQHSTSNNIQLNTLNPFSTSQSSNMTRNMLQTTQFQTSNPSSTTIRTNPPIHATYTQPFTNTPNILSNTSNVLTYITIPLSTKPQSTVSHPNYINSSTLISEHIKLFDGLDHNCSPEQYLQHIEARVTFSLGLQPTSDYEYKLGRAQGGFYTMLFNWHSS